VCSLSSQLSLNAIHIIMNTVNFRYSRKGGEKLRTIVNKKSAASATKSLPEPEKADDYLTRLLKYIPAETVAIWTVLSGIVVGAGSAIAIESIMWLIFIVIAILTPLYLWRVAKVTNGLQIAISTVAFVVWVFALGGPFALYTWYNPIYGAILLPIVTFAIPIVQG
jgi:hypothetical protein